MCEDLTEVFAVEYQSATFQCGFDAAHQRLMVHVPVTQACAGADAIARLVDLANELPCTHVVVYIHKVHGSFADWLRRFLYQGFGVHRTNKRWADAPAGADVIMCALDLADMSQSDSGGSAVTGISSGDDTDTGADTDADTDDDDEEE